MNTKVTECTGKTRSTAAENGRKRAGYRAAEGAFSFIDLIVTIAVFAAVGVMILPRLGRAGTNSPAAQCLNNMRQLGIAWAMYSSDSQGKLIESHPWTMVNGFRQANTANPYSWAPGYAGTLPGYPLSHPSYCPTSDYYNTNQVGLTRSVFFKYYGAINQLKCGSDKRMGGNPGGPLNPVLRSYAMNSFMSGGAFSGRTLFTKDTQIKRPSDLWVLIDEDEISLDDSYFVTIFTDPWRNMPARRHEGGFAWNFADGHSAVYKFTDPAVIARTSPVSSGQMVGSLNTTDWMIFTNRTSY